MAKNSERRYHDSYGFGAAGAEAVAAASKAKAQAKTPEVLTDDESALLADIARRLRASGFDLVSFSVSTLKNTANAEQFST